MLYERTTKAVGTSKMPVPTILQSPIEHLLQKLQQAGIELPDNKLYLQHAKDSLRWLNIKLPMNILKHDRPEARTVVVLEHVLKQKCQVSLPLNILASLVGIKVNNLQQLQLQIGHYLVEHDRPPEQRVLNKGAKRPSPSFQNNSLSTSTKRRSLRNDTLSLEESSSHSAQPTLMSELSIRLAGPLSHNNTQDLIVKAHQVWKDYQAHVNAISNIHERRGQLYDLQRYASAYQTACWYMAATDATDTTSRKGKSRLPLQELVDAFPSLRLLELQQVLQHVQTWAASQPKSATVEEPKKSKAKSRSNASQKKAVPPDSSTNVSSLGFLNSEQPLQTLQSHGVNQEEPATTLDFASWRSQTLGLAKEQARARIQLDSPSESQLLEDAANKVLLEYGISME
jgi:hypothetical protein